MPTEANTDRQWPANADVLITRCHHSIFNVGETVAEPSVRRQLGLELLYQVG